MNQKTKLAIIGLLNDHESYTCIYGVRNELFNIDKNGISGYGSSTSEYTMLSFKDDEVSLDELKSISISVDLFNNKGINKQGFIANGYIDDVIDKITELSKEDDIIYTFDNLSGVWVFIDKDNNLRMYSYLDRKEHRLYEMVKNDDDFVVFGDMMIDPTKTEGYNNIVSIPTDPCFDHMDWYVPKELGLTYLHIFSCTSKQVVIDYVSDNYGKVYNG